MGCNPEDCSSCKQPEKDIEEKMKNKAYNKEITMLGDAFNELKKGKPWSIKIEGMRIPQTLTEEEKVSIEKITKNFKHVKVEFVKD